MTPDDLALLKLLLSKRREQRKRLQIVREMFAADKLMLEETDRQIRSHLRIMDYEVQKAAAN